MTGTHPSACTRLFRNRVEGVAFENPFYTEAGWGCWERLSEPQKASLQGCPERHEPGELILLILQVKASLPCEKFQFTNGKHHGVTRAKASASALSSNPVLFHPICATVHPHFLFCRVRNEDQGPVSQEVLRWSQMLAWLTAASTHSSP